MTHPARRVKRPQQLPEIGLKPEEPKAQLPQKPTQFGLRIARESDLTAVFDFLAHLADLGQYPAALVVDTPEIIDRLSTELPLTKFIVTTVEAAQALPTGATLLTSLTGAQANPDRNPAIDGTSSDPLKPLAAWSVEHKTQLVVQLPEALTAWLTVKQPGLSLVFTTGPDLISSKDEFELMLRTTWAKLHPFDRYISGVCFTVSDPVLLDCLMSFIGSHEREG